ncbi:MAG: hypothetical protein ACJ76N_27820 [Thermoanaerobaculia bacterium]
MLRQAFNLTNLAGIQEQVYLSGIPDLCPWCHRHMQPAKHNFVAAGQNKIEEVYGLFQCSRIECQKAFLGIYTKGDVPPDAPGNQKHFYLSDVKPRSSNPPVLPELVRNLSPSFERTYTQAYSAEAADLEQLTGIGLRKALEFLIKDYAMHKHPDKEEQIKKQTLAECIREYIADQNLKASAKRAAWLGNDETHYVRIWANRDVEDLKILLRLAINWLENELLTEKYINEMPE